MYRFYCDICHFSQYMEADAVDLIEFKRNPIQRNIPVYDEKTKKTIPSTTKKQMRVFKCPGCGRLIKPAKMK